MTPKWNGVESGEKQNPAWMKIAFKDLRHAGNETINYIAANKQELIDVPVSEAIEKGDIPRDNRTAISGYIQLRCMAMVFDMFMALAED